LNWVKVNSTKKTIRYHPPEVLTALDELSLANEKLTVACRAAWDSFLRGFSQYFSKFQAAVQALATLDCLHSLAILSRNKVYSWRNDYLLSLNYSPHSPFRMFQKFSLPYKCFKINFDFCHNHPYAFITVNMNGSVEKHLFVVTTIFVLPY
jgi:hypothetical protein